jgi:Protein of unknown function with HXXEE motif
MSGFLTRNSLYLVSATAAIVGVCTVLRWPELPVLSRMVGLFFVGLVAHVWEENRFPGGFAEMIAAKLHFTAKSKQFGEAITMALVVCIAFVPLFFPQFTFLLLAPMLLGVLEAVMHTAMIRVFHLKRPYSPGLATALFILLPISAYSLSYAIGHHLVTPLDWLAAFLYMAVGLVIAQRIVVTASGVSYSEFLRNARAAVFRKTDSD